MTRARDREERAHGGELHEISCGKGAAMSCERWRRRAWVGAPGKVCSCVAGLSSLDKVGVGPV